MDGFSEFERQAYISHFVEQVRADFTPGDEEIEAYYESNRDEFQQPAVLTLWNIFRRHEPGGEASQTVRYLKELSDRFLAGETFSELARQHSQSETQRRGGLVGTLSAEQLPSRLARIATSLEPGGISEPVLVEGGALLLHVTRSSDPVTLSLMEARRAIEQKLFAEAVDRAIEFRIDGKAPASAVVLESDELLAALDAPDSANVLEIGDWTLSADQLREVAGVGRSTPTASLGPEAHHRVFDQYQQIRDRWLLAATLAASDDQQLTDTVSDEVLQQARTLLVEDQIDATLRQAIEGDRERLEAYFEDNRLRYQTPLRYKLTRWSLPFDDAPPQQLHEMVEQQEALSSGSTDLAAAVAEVGGTLEELGWLEFEELRQYLPSKAVQLLVSVGDRGFAPPYQQDDALHLLWLQEQDPPRPLEYDQALTAETTPLVDDYLDRFGQEVYAELLEDRLRQVGFEFEEAAVRSSFGWPTATAE